MCVDYGIWKIPYISTISSHRLGDDIWSSTAVIADRFLQQETYLYSKSLTIHKGYAGIKANCYTSNFGQFWKS